MSPTSSLVFAPAKAGMDPAAQRPQHQPAAGNLENVLSQFDRQTSSASSSTSPPPTVRVLDNEGGEDASERERSLTMGSEFDLGWILGKDGRGMSIVDDGLLGEMDAHMEETHDQNEHNGVSNNDGATSITVGSGSTAGSAVSAQQGQQQQQQQPQQGANNNHVRAGKVLPCLPEEAASSSSSSSRQDQQSHQQRNQNQNQNQQRERGDSTASQFLNGLYRQQHRPQQQQQQQQGQGQHHNYQQQPRATMMAHTPPTQLGTSYEKSHFGKRMRAGSISGRLRSASDLEDAGAIDRDQKAVLKDLIIAGDDSVQGAIDEYEAGNPSALEEMIKSGALLARSAEVDLLGDLDLDFLNVHGGEEDGDDDHGMVFGNMDDVGGARMRSSGGAASGDIGDLEFNGDFSGPDAMEPARVPSGGYGIESQHGLMAAQAKARGNSIDDLEVHRMRANSLALPGLLLDGANPDDVSQLSFGRWMDKYVAGGGPPMPHAMQVMQGAAAGAPGHLQQELAFDNAPNGRGKKNRFNPKRRPQVSSECNVLMASKSKATKRDGKKSKPKKEKTKKSSATKKDKKEPRERKSQSKMKDMMEGIASSGDVAAAKAEEEERKETPTSGLGRPRSMSDPNLSVRLDDRGLLHVDGPEGWVGAYSPDSRALRVERFLEKRNHRVWVKKVKYDVRKNFADSRLRVKGRFVKKEDEMLMRELMSLT